MIAAERDAFVCELISDVQRQVREQVAKMPDTWNGVQLRQYIADKFSGKLMVMSRSEKKTYEAELLSHNIE